MTNSADKREAHAVAVGLKQAAMAGSAVALVMGVACSANASVISHTLGSPVTLNLNTASSSAFDINTDGINDFTLMSSGGCSASTTCSISVVPSAGNKVYLDTFLVPPGPQAAAEPTFGAFESSLYSGNPFKHLSPNTASLAESIDGASPIGKWSFDTESAVLGLDFQAGGKNYLGYIHGTVSNPSNDPSMSIAFDSFGYNTTAVPEADTLSLLAMGMVGVGALRRRRKAVKA